ncbi:MAG: hypothetical protein LC737_11570 [Chloroflexi bacterium]|nr:hypothetical protein [Chloroflexota bacterium]
MSNARMLDEKTVLEIIDQMRTTVPEEVRVAKQIQQQRDRVIAQGKEEGERIVQLARQHSEDMVMAHEISRMAEARSHTIIERAQREADDIRRGADGYAEQVLRVLDERIAHAQHQIRSGLVELANRHGEPAPTDNESEPDPNAAPSDINEPIHVAAEHRDFLQ